MKTQLLLIAFLISLFSSLTAQIIHVPGDQPSIQAGINAALDGDTILVAENTWYENIRFKGKAITVASNFILDGDTSHINNTIIDGSQPVDPDSASTVMFISGEDTTSVLCGFTIMGGTGMTYATWDNVFGGGIACLESGAKITHNKIIDNMIIEASKTSGGVGIGSISLSGNFLIIIDNNVISDNVCITNAESAFGGGIYVTTNAKIRNNTIENNNCYNEGTWADGGGIEVQQLSGTTITVFIQDNIIRNNVVEGDKGAGAGIRFIKAGGFVINNSITNNEIIGGNYGFGAAIDFYQPTGEIQIIGNEIVNNTGTGQRVYGEIEINMPSGEILISNNLISENTLTAQVGSAGSALDLIKPAGAVRILNNEITGNTATGADWSYGGIFLYEAENTDVLVDGNIFKNNSATSVGGFYAKHSYHLKLNNNLFSGNNVDSRGGALFFHQYYGKHGFVGQPPENNDKALSASPERDDQTRPLVINNTFINNHAGEQGGAIFIADYYDTLCPVIVNNNFWNNSANDYGNDIYHGGDEAIHVSNNNLNSNSIYGNWTGDNNINVNPEFKDDSCHLDWSSQCVNAGIDSLEVYGVWYYSPVTDIDGDARPFEWTLPDIGIDEAQWYYVGMEEPKVQSLKFRVWNYPNPFTTSTTIAYELQQPATVQITIYNHLGKQVAVITENRQPKGKQQLRWSAENLPGGIYYCVLRTDRKLKTKKMMKLK